MINRLGFTGLIKNLSPPRSTPVRSGGRSTIIGRVTDVILDNNHPKFQELGGWQSIGTVIFEPVGKFNVGIAVSIAKPFFPNIQNYPLVNELIMVLRAPTSIQDTNDFTSKGYYISNIDLWNSPHSNALPNPLVTSNNTPTTPTGVPVQVGTSGDIPEATLNSPTNPSQQTFVEKDNIHPLQSYAGDLIYEGRFGQSIRFGNTTKGTNNTWSSVGGNGDPIMILRNGQNPEITTDGWVPTVENLDKDLSTIYLTSTQKLSVDNNTISRFTPFSTLGRAITLNNYTGPQIFTNTDRIVLNAKNDSVLIGSKKGISLFTEEYMNVKSRNLFIDAQNVKLGNENATEPLLLGDKTADLLSRLITQLTSICNVLLTDQIYPGGTAIPNESMNKAAINALSVLNELQTQLPTLKSKVSKTI